MKKDFGFMASVKDKVETALDEIRKVLASAGSAAAVLAAGERIKPLLLDIEGNCEALEDQIAEEAESLDRTRSKKLRAELTALRDLMTDAEYLDRRIGERHASLLLQEQDAVAKEKAAAVNALAHEQRLLARDMAATLQRLHDQIGLYKSTRDKWSSTVNFIRNELKRADLELKAAFRSEEISAAIKFSSVDALDQLLNTAVLESPLRYLSALSSAMDRP
jgi:DNA repair exonuclease SbcCD ATPase subunit